MRALLAAVLVAAVLALTWVATRPAEPTEGEPAGGPSTSLAAEPDRALGGRQRSGTAPSAVGEDALSLEAPSTLPSERVAEESAGSQARSQDTSPGTPNDAEPAYPVRFTVSHPMSPPEDAAAFLLVRAADEEEPKRHSLAPDVQHEEALPPGDYLAAVEIPEIGVGPTAAFTVTEGETDVAVEAPYRFDVGMTALLRSNELPLEGVEFVFERVDDPARLAGPARISARTAPDGKARLEGLVQGKWHLFSIADGHWSGDWELSLPWEDAKESIRTGGQMYVTPILFEPIESISLRLDTSGAATTPEGYTAKQRYSDEEVPFGPDGRVTLTLEDHYLPLLVEVNDHAGTALEYLLEELPVEGKEYLIPLESPRVLDVDVRLGEAVRSLGDDWQLKLVVFHRMPNGDDAIVNLDIPGEGVYEIPYANCDVVNVGLKAWRKPDLLGCVSKEVRLAPSGRTTCILRADGPPPQVRVVNAAGEGVPDHHVQTFRLPRSTSWFDGGRTDEAGVLDLDLSRTQTNYLMLADEGGGNALGLDLPLDLPEVPSGDGPVVVRAAPTTKTYFQMEPGSGDPSGVIIWLEGARTGYPYQGYDLNESGRSNDSALIEGSQATVVLNLACQWSPTPRFPLQPGRNTFRAHATGTLTLSSTDHLGSVRSTEYGQTLADWKAADNLTTASAGSLLECTVPIGAYEITHPDGSISTLQVRKGESIHGGL